MYYTYILRCEDNSLYTGITNNIVHRLSEHLSKGNKCAKYTLKHTVIKLEIAWQSETRSLASKLEYRIKKLNKQQKEDLICNKNLSEFFEGVIDTEDYIICKITKNQVV